MKKKYLRLFAMLPFSFLLSSCFFSYLSSDKAGERLCNKIIGFIEKRDVDGMYEAFSKNMKENVPDLKDQIQELFEYIKGDEIYCNYFLGGGCQNAFEEGEWMQSVHWIRGKINTEQARYRFSATWDRLDKYDPKDAGIQNIYCEEFYGMENFSCLDGIHIYDGEEENSNEE